MKSSWKKWRRAGQIMERNSLKKGEAQKRTWIKKKLNELTNVIKQIEKNTITSKWKNKTSISSRGQTRKGK